MMSSKTALYGRILFSLVTLTLISGSYSFFLEWGPDLEGPWCAQRPRGEDCCDGRDDNCAVPILGTECYCDVFCNDTAYDCCPDYWVHCHGFERKTTTPRPTILPPPRTTRPSPILQPCEKYGVSYRPGDRFTDNCNECSCELYSADERYYGLKCTDKVCLIRPELIDSVNGGRYTWRASNYSKFWGTSLEDGLRYRLGTHPLDPDVLQMTPIKVRQDEVIPEFFDARVEWPDRLSPIEDQGNCASSWAFSTTAVAADRLSIETNGAIKENLSPQHLLSCHTDVKDGCTGGKLDRAWWFLRKYGVVSEACYPYTSGKTNQPGPCLMSVSSLEGDCPSAVTYNVETRYKASPPYRIRASEREIMKEIMDNGPVQATFLVKEDFYIYRSGVYQYSNLTRLDPPEAQKSAYHSVRLLGWGVDRTLEGDIIKYWIGANSWGPEWGENGYFRILRGSNHMEIETYIVGVWGRISGDVELRSLFNEQRRLRLRQQGQVQVLDEDEDILNEEPEKLGLSKQRRRRHRGGLKELRSLELKKSKKKKKNGKKEKSKKKKSDKKKEGKKQKGKKSKSKSKKGKKTKKTTTKSPVSTTLAGSATKVTILASDSTEKTTADTPSLDIDVVIQE